MPGKDDKLFGYKYKNCDQFYEISDKPNESAHLVTKTFKISKKSFFSILDKKSIFFLKPYGDVFLKKNIHELEATSAEIYRFLLGPNRAPKVRVLIDEKNKAWGTVSKQIPDFKSFYEARNEKLELVSDKALIEAGFGSLMAASYALEEYDLHGNNYGFNDSGKLSRIDFDQNLLPLAGIHYLYKEANVKYLNNLFKNSTFNFGNNPSKEHRLFKKGQMSLDEMENFY
ncbi:MAG: hypothetical protein LEGION0398_MBIBDBAK_01364 [Legionellaceae bacterium]